MSKKLAERWVTLLVLPGALFLSVSVLAHVQGQRHPFDFARASRWISTLAATPTLARPGGIAIAVVGFLVGAAVVGICVQGIAGLIERLWLAENHQRWPWPLRSLAAHLLTRRRARWQSRWAAYRSERETRAQARAEGRTDVDTEPLSRAFEKVAQIAIHHPERPTWIGDRINAVSRQLDDEYRLDATTLWPALWLTMPTTSRNDIAQSCQGLSQSASLSAWGVTYLAVSVLSWPLAVVGVVLITSGWRRARRCADEYARLVECAFRLHSAETARSLGIEHDGVLNAQTGWALTCLLQGRGE